MAGGPERCLGAMEAGEGARRRRSLLHVEPGTHLCSCRCLEVDESDVARRQRTLRNTQTADFLESWFLAAVTLCRTSGIGLLRSDFRTALRVDFHSAQRTSGEVRSDGGAAGIPRGHLGDAADSLCESCLHCRAVNPIQRRVDGQAAPWTIRIDCVVCADAPGIFQYGGDHLRDYPDPGDDQLSHAAAVAER